MLIVCAADVLPLESVTVAVNVIVPEVGRNPVVNCDDPDENPPPEIEYEAIELP